MHTDSALVRVDRSLRMHVLLRKETSRILHNPDLLLKTARKVAGPLPQPSLITSVVRYPDKISENSRWRTSCNGAGRGVE